MREYIFYTNEGNTLAPKKNKDVDNCQILGVTFGNDIEDAKCQLELNNPWIRDCGFDIEKSCCYQIISEENMRDISTIIEYLSMIRIPERFNDGTEEQLINEVLLRLKEMIE